MLALAHAAIPDAFEVATVDHGLRPESAAEAAMVAQHCAELGVPHEVLAVDVAPGNLQDRARAARYAALAQWLDRRDLSALATAHHADDQAETLIMRLNRGSGLAGLAGVRGRGRVPGTSYPLLRPLLAWRRAQLADVVRSKGWEAAQDPSNRDPKYDRVRIRTALADADWLDPNTIARSATNLADAVEALDWATEREWCERVEEGAGELRYRPEAPRSIRLEILKRAIVRLGGEARGSAIASLLDTLEAGGGGTLGGAHAINRRGVWIIRSEPPRNC